MADDGDTRANDANAAAAAFRRRDGYEDGYATRVRNVVATTLALKLILLMAVMAIAYLAFSVCLRNASPMHVAAAAVQESRPIGTGIKDAIQDLYAEIKASESDGSPYRSAVDRLDVATSAKAQYVSDSLRRMIGGGGGGVGGGDDLATRDGAAAGGGHAGRPADGYYSSARDRPRTGSKPRTGESPPPLSHEDVNELVQRFFDVLDYFDRMKSSSSSATTAAVAEQQRGGRGPSSAARRRSGRGLAAARSTPSPGLFKLAMFNRHQRVTSPAAAR